MEVQAELCKIIINETVDQQIIVLKEKGGERAFPIVIGMNEILAIDRRIKGLELARPMTHDLMHEVIKKMGGKIEKIVITDLNSGTFYGRIYVKIGERTVDIDSRPSDAIALVSGTDTAIFVDDRVFDQTMM